MRAVIVSFVIVMGAGATSRAAATPPGDTASAKAHFAAGRAYANHQRYDEAMHEFELGYRLKPSPLFLYNIGMVARQANEPARAVDAFEAYLRAAPQAPDRAEVQRWVASLRETVERERPPAPSRAEPPAATSAPAPATVPLTPAPAAAATSAPASGASPAALMSASPPPPDKRKSRRALWIALGTVGGALVIGGVVTGVVLGTRGNGTPSGYHDLGSLGLGSH
jgi:hypothetical protein